MGSLACFGSWSWLIWLIIIFLFIWLLYRACCNYGYGYRGCGPYNQGGSGYWYDSYYY